MTGLPARSNVIYLCYLLDAFPKLSLQWLRSFVDLTVAETQRRTLTGFRDVIAVI